MGRSGVDTEVEDYFNDADKHYPIKSSSGKQLTLDGGEESEDLQDVANMILGAEMADRFEVKMALILKPKRDNSIPIAIPIVRGTCRAHHVEESIDIAMKGSYFRNQLRAAVGNAKGDLLVELTRLKDEMALKAPEGSPQ